MGTHEINLEKTVPRLDDQVNFMQDKIYISGKYTYYICHGHQFNTEKEKSIVFCYTTFVALTVVYRINKIYNIIRS
ncbi:MAG: hypothetical protein WCH65_08745 [bacterium]